MFRDDENQIDEYLSSLNSLHRSQRFKIELENTDRLSSLDALIIKDEFSIAVHQNPTFTGKYISRSNVLSKQNNMAMRTTDLK